jgi:molybdenum cofactor guanylyltransferase
MVQSLNFSSNLLGVVMCGGLSTRMGRDKGLIRKDNVTWAEIAFNNLAAIDIPVYVSVNEFQVSAYKKIFGINNLIVDDNGLNGPLKGLMAVHRQFPEKDLFILASDMINMNPDLLEALRMTYFQKRNYNFYVYKNDAELEPLCGIYTAEALDRIWNDYLSKQLPKHSMKFILSSGSLVALSVPHEKKTCFANHNEPSDLNSKIQKANFK